jgi:ketosteroid isomerase-like protein
MQAQVVLGAWWLAYDEGDFDRMRALVSDDVTFKVRTDTGVTDFEDFVRVDLAGADQVLEWNTQHRLDSPHPLRHQVTNLHVTGQRDGNIDFASYLFVTQVQDVFPSPLSSGIVRGTVRADGDDLRLSAFELVLDTQTSVPFRDRG